MKTVCTLLLLFVSTIAMAKIITVNNKGGAQFTSLQAAADAASHGDTVYVHGSTDNYGTLNVRRRLILIGAGIKPINQQNLATMINTINLIRDNGTADATGTVICGFVVASQLIGYAGTQGLPINNIRIFRNSINTILVGGSGAYNEGWLIYNNRINIIYGSGNTSASGSRNVALQNNFINSVQNFNEPSVIIDHNLFLSSGNLFNVYYAIISNNIFVRSSGEIFSSNVNYCTFSNNFSNLTTVASASNYSPANSFVHTFLGAGGGANTGGNNITGADIQFENVTNLNTFNDTFNYRLRTTSPAKNAGSDGTDLGVYAAPYPFPSGGPIGSGFDTSPLPPVPQVSEVIIQNATVNPNGTITVRVRANVNN